jgi:small acid-soluble spore protein D (minor alpha/beta-type SASP)
MADCPTDSRFTVSVNGSVEKQTVQNRRNKTMASNKTLVPEAKEALERFKMEAANEVGVNLKQGYNGDITARQAGSVGGQMVKKMIESYENSIKTK